MDQLPDHRTPLSAEPWQPHTQRGAHVRARPKTWLGKLIVGVVGAVVTLAALFLSLMVLAVVASILLVGVVYILWRVRRARRAVQRQTIDMS